MTVSDPRLDTLRTINLFFVRFLLAALGTCVAVVVTTIPSWLTDDCIQNFGAAAVIAAARSAIGELLPFLTVVAIPFWGIPLLSAVTSLSVGTLRRIYLVGIVLGVASFAIMLPRLVPVVFEALEKPRVISQHVKWAQQCAPLRGRANDPTKPYQ
ncbi:hypothetical protein [Roseiterribacter gracilis]|uniref:Uncharacterized protein n=1 Tax=Roseiterribacter gracilis TaxID=2812848 RepID=A0A8S8XIM3_9PROT|nr:hypothetical protein TMPK1_32620 [Rhodospirillales bacterium TMPK1]